MSTTTDDLSDRPEVQAIGQTTAWPHNGAWHRRDDTDHYEGRMWVNGDNTVTLLAPDATQFGYVDLSEFRPAEYLETRTVGDNRGYAFTAGASEATANVEYVRWLANDVFGVSYDTLKNNAETIPDADIRGVPEGVSPILFDPPNSPFRALVAPLIE